jgi:plastocyanin
MVFGADLQVAEAQQPVRIEMVSPNPRFEPANVTVPVGTTVTWTLVAGGHSTTSATGLWDSGVTREVGDVLSYTFSQPGTYSFFCIPHQAVGMVGTVTVTAAAAAPAAPARAAGPAAGPAPAQAPRALPRAGSAASAGAMLLLASGGLASLAAGLAVRSRRRDDSVE